jgi:uncharacterized integral membrane protein
MSKTNKAIMILLLAVFNGSLAFLLPNTFSLALIPYFLYCAISGGLLGAHLSSK